MSYFHLVINENVYIQRGLVLTEVRFYFHDASIHITTCPPQRPSASRGCYCGGVFLNCGLVAAITSAIVSGQQQSLQSRSTIVASIAAESMLATLSQEPWETIDSWHGYSEGVGEIVDATGMSIGGDWNTIGRKVAVIETDLFVDTLQVVSLQGEQYPSQYLVKMAESSLPLTDLYRSLNHES